MPRWNMGTSEQSSSGGNGALGIGLGTIAGIGGNVLGNIGARRRQQEAYEQQKRLMGLQAQYQKGLNVQGHDLQFDMWKKTNYPAQMEMIKEAGLNPALMYGMSGGGGTTAGSQGGGSASGGSAPSPAPYELNAGLEQAMKLAQIELMKAQAKKTDTERTKIEGPDTEKVITEIQDITQGIENKKAQEHLLKAQETATNLDNMLKGKTLEEQANIVSWTLNKLKAEVSSATSQAYVDSKTMNEKINILKNEAINSWLNQSLIKSNINLNKKKVSEITNSILQKWQDLRIKDDQVKVGQVMNEIKKEYPSISNWVGKGATVIENGLREILNWMSWRGVR